MKKALALAAALSASTLGHGAEEPDGRVEDAHRDTSGAVKEIVQNQETGVIELCQEIPMPHSVNVGMSDMPETVRVCD